MDGPSIQKRVSVRWEALKKERSSWMSHWSEISDYLLPRSGRFFVEDRNKGNKRHKNIYDNTGTRHCGAGGWNDGRHDQSGSPVVSPHHV